MLTKHLPNPSRAGRALVPLLAALVVALAAASCNRYSAPTSPYGGGSTGGGGTGGGGTGMPFDLGPFAIGESAQLTFSSSGTFGYHCNAHRAMGMIGTVQVDANGADSLLVQIGASGFTFTPSTAHIRPGGHVRWVNTSGLANHTVTSD
jgi:plastocyanin